MTNVLTAHRPDLTPDEARAVIAARMLLVECEPQPPAEASIMRSGSKYGWWEDGEDPIIRELDPCPYRVGDVVEIPTNLGANPMLGLGPIYRCFTVVEIGEPIDVLNAPTAPSEDDVMRYWAVYDIYLSADRGAWAWPVRLEERQRESEQVQRRRL